MNRAPYLIIGNSVAAVGGIAGIREVDDRRPITVVAKEPYHVYSRPLISYLLAGRVKEADIAYREADFYENNKVSALLGVEAVRIDTEARAVHAAGGRVIGFEKLLIATGGKPIVPGDVPGTEAAGVFSFTGWDDARNVKSFIERHSVKRATVVGGGLIGLKSAEALVALGVKVTIVELADRILSVTFDKTASDLARKFLERVGVAVRCSATVSRIEQKEGRVAGAVLRDGTELPCELLIFAIGVVPNTDVVKGTPIKVERGILVDSTLQTSVAGIYAAGDVAEAEDILSGKRRPIPIFPNAYRQGFIAGSNMAGRNRNYEGGLAMNSVDICGLPTISVGITSPQDQGYEVLSTLDEEKMSYKKVVLKGDRIVGAIFIGQIDRAGIFTGLIQHKVNVSSFKNLLLTDQFGLICLPAEYRKHVVSGAGVEV